MGATTQAIPIHGLIVRGDYRLRELVQSERSVIQLAWIVASACATSGLPTATTDLQPAGAGDDLACLHFAGMRFGYLPTSETLSPSAHC